MLCGCPKSVVVTPPVPPPTAYNIGLTWTDSTPVAKYIVKRNGTTLATVSSTTYIDKSVLAGTYAYSVSACNSANACSAASNTVNAIVP